MGAVNYSVTMFTPSIETTSVTRRCSSLRLRLPRQRSNNGKALVTVDLSEITHRPMPTRALPRWPAFSAPNILYSVYPAMSGIGLRRRRWRGLVSGSGATPPAYITIHKLIVIGLIAHFCIEATVRFAVELGYEVTVVKDATADYSDEEMHAALDVNIPNYASAIVTAKEVVDSISSL
jgi:Isochorismatase family